MIIVSQHERTLINKKAQPHQTRMWLQGLVRNAVPGLCWLGGDRCYRLRFLAVVSQITHWYEMLRAIQRPEDIFIVRDLTIYGILTEQKPGRRTRYWEDVLAFRVMDMPSVLRLQQDDLSEAIRAVFDYEVPSESDTIINPWENVPSCVGDWWVRYVPSLGDQVSNDDGCHGLFFAMQCFTDGAVMMLKIPLVFANLQTLIAHMLGLLPIDQPASDWVTAATLGYPDEFSVWAAFHQDPLRITALLALSS